MASASSKWSLKPSAFLHFTLIAMSHQVIRLCSEWCYVSATYILWLCNSRVSGETHWNNLISSLRARLRILSFCWLIAAYPVTQTGSTGSSFFCIHQNIRRQSPNCTLFLRNKVYTSCLLFLNLEKQ